MGKLYKLKKQFKTNLPQFCLNGMSNLWIVKPSGNSKGQGIHLISDIEEAMINGSQNQARIIQKYVETPLIFFDPEFPLLHNKKFDIRQWVLVSSVTPLKIHMFSASYLRICSSEFDLRDFKDPMKHLTNFSVNKTQYKGRLEDSICSSLEFARYLKTTHNVDWDTQIKPGFVNLITETILSVTDQLVHKPGCFELYGFDILLDQNYKPWLLEVNLSPACAERTPWLTEMLDYMTEGMLKIVLPKTVLATDEVPDPDSVELPKKDKYQWELIYTGEDVGGVANGNNIMIANDLEILGTKADIKKEKDLDKLYHQYM